MNEIEKAIKHFENMYNESYAVLQSGFGKHKGENDLLYRRRKSYAKLAVEALKERQKYEKLNKKILTEEKLKNIMRVLWLESESVCGDEMVSYYSIEAIIRKMCGMEEIEND